VRGCALAGHSVLDTLPILTSETQGMSKHHKCEKLRSSSYQPSGIPGEPGIDSHEKCGRRAEYNHNGNWYCERCYTKVVTVTETEDEYGCDEPYCADDPNDYPDPIDPEFSGGD
jgi:hypothetical protein